MRPVSIRAVTRYSRADRDVARIDQDMVASESPVSLVVCPPSGPPRDLGLLMRTPGHDDDLAHGALVTQGVVARADDIIRIEHERAPREADASRGAETIRVFVGPDATIEAGRERVSSATSACGLCGQLSLMQLDSRPGRVATTLRVSAEVVHSTPERLREAQPAFAQTGGLHAAAALTPDGTLIELREDVGRHNAVDKIAGALLRRRQLPADNLILAVSGRIAYEIVQKAVMCGLQLIVAVGAPTDLAIDAARATGITLIGFVRDGRFNVYTHPDRVIGGENSPRSVENGQDILEN